ncbi:MAG: phosphoglucosamine mutase [Acidimicrobiales bacterium]
MPPRFGTDGIRGVANTELTPEFALALGRAAARRLEGRAFLVGRDTRRSGAMLQAALSAGLASEGREVIDVGVIPTPGLAWLAASRQVPAAMISASHNPFTDNGIKLFGADGAKLSADGEEAIQTELDVIVAGGDVGAGDGEQVGTIGPDPGATSEYVDRLVAVVGSATMPEGEVVIDCAHGAASYVAPLVFERLGVRHHVLFAEPEGTNINAGCGSTHLGPLTEEVVRRQAALGIAFDGDADRMLAVDHKGGVIDGDHLIAMFAADLRRSGALVGDTVVVTVLSNLGLRIGLKAAGIDVVETPVGDRHVADALETGGYVLGGEQSGHLIFRQHASTGDGILTALKLLELLGRTGRPVAELADEAMRRLPQVLVNVPVPEPDLLKRADAVWDEAARVERELGDAGRVLLRRSGTESCVRVMVEAETAEDAERYAEQIAAVVRRELA